MSITTITQNGKTKYKYGSQLFSSMSAAQRAMGRIQRTTGKAQTVLNTAGKTKQQVLDAALKSGQVKMQGTQIIGNNGQVIGDTTKFNLEDQAAVYNKETGKRGKPSATEQTSDVQPESTIQAADDAIDSTQKQDQESLSGPQEKVDGDQASIQAMIGGKVGGMNVGMTKQQVIDNAVQSGQITVDEGGNIYNKKTGQKLMNIDGIDLTQSTIGQAQPNANADIQQQQQIGQQQNKQDQQNINNIRPDTSLGLSNSPDSPFWNQFGNGAIEMEDQMPGYLNERNKVIASSIMLNNTNMKFMSEAMRKDLILKDIIDRQEGGIDPAMESRYAKTIDNINSLITRQMPPYKANDFFNMLVNGEQIDYTAAKGNPELKSARSRFNDLQTYSSMDDISLSEAIASGKLNKGGQLWNDLLNKGMGEILNSAYSMYNTKLQSSVSDYLSGQYSGFDSNKALEGQGSSKIDLGTGLDAVVSEKLLSLMTEDKLPTFASRLAEDDEVQGAKAAAKATEKQILDLSDQITEFADDIKTKVVERGGEASDDPFLQAYIEEKQKPFVKTLTQLQSQYRNEIAILSDLSENARTAFEVKEYNKNMQIQGYQFLLSRLDKQAEIKRQQQAADLAQSNRERSFALQKEQFDYQKSKSDIPNPQIIGYDNNGKAIYGIRDKTSKSFKTINKVTKGVQAGTNQRSSINVGGATYKVGDTAPGRLGTIGSGVITQIGGPTTTSGLDIDGKIGDSITSPFDGTVTRFGTDKTGNRYLEIQDKNGNKLLFNHLSGVGSYMEGDLKVGSKISAGQAIAMIGNTGNVIKGKGGDGSHLDLVGFNSNGQRMTMPELMEYVTTGGKPQQQQGITRADIISFNDETSRRKLDKDTINILANQKAMIMDNPESDIYDILSRSLGGKELGNEQAKTLVKYDQALDQVEAIQNQISDMKTGPILGKLKSINPRNTDAQILKAQLQGLVPTIARGIYGEVGVLTDNDIRLYAKTLPTLQGTDAINKGVLAYTLDILAGGYKNQLRSLAGMGYNVAGLSGVYSAMKSQADAIRMELGIIDGEYNQNISGQTNNQSPYSTVAPSPYGRWNP